MKSLKLLVFLFLGLMSCTEDVEINGGGGFKYKNYIQAYIDADTMHIWQNTQTNGYDKTSVAYAYLEGLVYDCKGNNGLENYRKKVNAGEFVYNNIGGVPSAYISKSDSTQIITINKEELNEYISDNSSKYNDIALKNNDTSWNGSSPIPLPNRVINDSIFAIEIITELDYDNNHTAGSNLADIVKFYCSSPYNYIQNGYKSTQKDVRTQEMIDNEISFGTYEMITCFCSDIQNIQTKFFEPHFDLLFTQKPLQKGTYGFEIKLKLSQKNIDAKI